MVQLGKTKKRTKTECLSLLEKHLTLSSLQVLADKCQKDGINEKIKKFKHLV